ncbi:MAG: homocysteine S-methyltransferase family protein [Bellilinea sp.]
MTNKFLDAIQSGKIIIADGATGSNLQQRGLPDGKSGEAWVLENPQAILALARDFIAAGAEILLTCTFGASRLHLANMGLDAECEQINLTGAKLARQAAESRGAFVAGSIGPTGQMLDPYGPLAVADAEAAFAEQARFLAAGGVDLIVIETQFDLGEAAAAVRGVRSACDLPLVCSFSYDRGTRTMMGVSPAKAALALNDSGVDLLGINCGRSLTDNLAALRELQAATSLPIWFKPNAGLPVTDDLGNVVYQTTPQQMAEAVPAWIAAGARVIGGCCGTSPEHLSAIAAARLPAI